jgi:5'(3')-deoxyribonucleotidase
MTRRPVLAVDVDECLFPFLERYARWLPSVGRPSFRIEDMTGFGVASLLGMGRVEAREFEMRFVIEASLDVPPMPGAQEAVDHLAQRFELHAVTARVEDPAGPATRAWLDAWFPGAFADAHLLSDTVESPARPKGGVCADLGAVALADDSPGNLQTLAGTGTSGVLLEVWPWTLADGDWFHAPDWDDAVGHLCGP